MYCILNKNIFYIAPFFLFAFFLVYSFCTTQRVVDDKNLAISPKNSIFLFDFDGVVATHEILQYSWGGLRAVAQHPWVLWLLFKPSFYRDLVRSITQNVYSNGVRVNGLYYYLEHLEKRHSLFTHDFKEALLQACTKQRPVPAVIETIIALKKSGYRVYVFTNKDRISLLKYVKPYIEKVYKYNFDALFDGYFCGEPSLKKPDSAIYNHVVHCLREEGIEHLIFFDDLQKNVDGAHKAHEMFKAFHLPNPHAIKQFSIILQALAWNE